MTIRTNQDRREFARDKFVEMAVTPDLQHAEPLRQITTRVLGFSAVNDAIIAPNHQNLPDSATVIGTLDSEFGPGYTAVHFDLSTQASGSARRSHVTNARVQAANRVVQQYAPGETYPLLIFTLPDNSGVQFVTGTPSPTNNNQLTNVVRVTAYWTSQSRTALDCLQRTGNAIADGEVPEKAFQHGFNVQPVTNEFFKAYKEAYDRAVTALTESVPRTDAEQFVQTLFNRMMFIHFISKKGWMTIKASSDYLNTLWQDYHSTPNEDNFYRNRLDPLFFHGLNNPRSNKLSSEDPKRYAAIGDVPFLNGGLFEKSLLDARATDGEFTVPDDVIKPVLTDLFNRHNFTVMEATPLDTEVAVDPEMLGKLFEETVNERNSNGAYYTPRPVVAFMCREALKRYLRTKEIAGVTDERITDLLDNRNPRAVTQQQAFQIATAVNEMKAVDPACGSGAFLLGMLQEIVALNNTLFRAGHTAESLYEQKLAIITNNIYGADKDGLAVSTAMLRLWLSLAVDYDRDRPPDPLPNLDLKLVVGDSIAGPDPQQMDFTLQSIVDSGLRQHVADYTTAQGPGKAALKQRVDSTKQKLRDNMKSAAPKGVVEWRIDFADVMLHGGFDIVVANPPYGMTVKDRRSALISHTDSYTNFMGLSIELAPNGLMAFITPTSWETGERFKKFRQYLFKKMALQSVVNLPYDVFETPYVDTAITIGAIAQPAPSEFRLATLDKRAELDLTRISDYMTSVSWSAVAGDVNLRIPLLDWAADLFGRVGANATPLGNITSSKRGIAHYKFDILDEPVDGAVQFFDAQVQRYRVGESSNDNFVVVSEDEKEFHRGTRILTRRLVNRANRLSFARTNETFVVKEALLAVKPKFDTPRKLAVLLAILNSSLMSFLYLSRSTAAVKDDFRQVTLTGLRELPIIFPDDEAMTQLEQLVDTREKQDNDLADLERRIDAIIYRTYGVTQEEQTEIAEWLAQSG